MHCQLNSDFATILLSRIGKIKTFRAWLQVPLVNYKKH